MAGKQVFAVADKLSIYLYVYLYAHTGHIWQEQRQTLNYGPHKSSQSRVKVLNVPPNGRGSQCAN